MTRRVAVVTGTRAEFGLLDPVMHAIREHPTLDLAVIVSGAHLLPQKERDGTWREVQKHYDIQAVVPMQEPGETGRGADAAALGRGVTGFANAFAELRPDWVVVLGDRIEAFAAASAASVGGVAVAQIHAGDRAEGVADEAMRHAITKLAHVHFAASAASHERILRMGERAETAFDVGSPAVDALGAIEPLADDLWDEVGAPEAVVLLHPIGAGAEMEATFARRIADAVGEYRVLWLHPNHDPDRDGILSVMREFGRRPRVRILEHLPRAEFVGLLRRLAASGGVLVGNSSAGLIEAGVLACPVVNVGHRQAGRECPNHVVSCAGEDDREVAAAISRALSLDPSAFTHPYGDGHAGQRIATVLADEGLYPGQLLRKQCTY